MARPFLKGAAVALAVLGIFRWQFARRFAPEPMYEVEAKEGPFEIRRYPAGVVAETTVTSSSRDQALNEGFRRLARYIFGETKGQELQAAVAAAAWKSQGAPTFAGYDPPSTLPWFRRNEVWLELVDAT